MKRSAEPSVHLYNTKATTMAVSARVQTYCLYLAGHHRAPAKSSYCGLGPLPPSLQHISSGAINRCVGTHTWVATYVHGRDPQAGNECNRVFYLLFVFVLSLPLRPP